MIIHNVRAACGNAETRISRRSVGSFGMIEDERLSESVGREDDSRYGRQTQAQRAASLEHKNYEIVDVREIRNKSNG